MTGLSFRPRIEEVENRITPAISPMDVYMAGYQVQMNDQILGYVTNPTILNNPATMPYVGNFLTYVHDTTEKATAVFEEFMASVQPQLMNPSMSEWLSPTVTMFRELQVKSLQHRSTTASYAGMLGITFAAPSTNTDGSNTLNLNPTNPSNNGGNNNNNNGNSGNNGNNSGNQAANSGMVASMPNTSGSDFTNIGNGVRIKDTVVGNGTVVNEGDKVVALYSLWSAGNGTEIQKQHDLATALNGQFTIAVGTGGVIKGFHDGVLGMKAGGIRQIFVPSSLGYDNGDLVFEVKIISVTPKAGSGNETPQDPIPDHTASDFVDIGDGIKAKDLTVGTGESVVAGDSIIAKYKIWSVATGALLESHLDATQQAANPISISATGGGLNKGVLGMKPGGKRQFFVPLTDGSTSTGLVYEFELLSIVDPTDPDELPAGMTETKPDTTGSDFTDLGNEVLIKDVTVGSGDAVVSGDSIVVQYTLWSPSGQIEDQRYNLTYVQNHPLNIPTAVSQGFASAVQGMQPGGIRQVFIPAELHDGSEDAVYEIKLLSIA